MLKTNENGKLYGFYDNTIADLTNNNTFLLV